MLKKFTATLDLDYAKSLGLQRFGDLFPLRYSEEYRDRLREEIQKINAKNKKNLAEGKPPVQLEVSISVNHKRRSVDQNSWLWKAHEIEARLINTKDQTWRDGHGVTWYKPGAVTSEEVHESYMTQYAPRGYIDVEPGFVNAVREMVEETTGRVIEEKWDDDKRRMIFTILKTSSYMNVAEFCQLAEQVKSNLLSYGIDLENASDYNALIADFETIKNLQKVPEVDTSERESSPTVKSESEPDESAMTVKNEDAPILNFNRDPVGIVESVFGGQRE